MAPRVSKSPKQDKAVDQMAIDAADVFTASNQARKEAEKKYANAKQALFLFLGPRLTKALSDGRTIVKTVTPIPPEVEPRSGFDRVTLAVMPPAPE
jgi:hypothetical protein